MWQTEQIAYGKIMQEERLSFSIHLERRNTFYMKMVPNGPSSCMNLTMGKKVVS